MTVETSEVLGYLKTEDSLSDPYDICDKVEDLSLLLAGFLMNSAGIWFSLIELADYFEVSKSQIRGAFDYLQKNDGELFEIKANRRVSKVKMAYKGAPIEPTLEGLAAEEEERKRIDDEIGSAARILYYERFYMINTPRRVKHRRRFCITRRF
jgi:hypothetical protein